MGVSMAETLANTRKEATRRQRIEAEQRRRDELRDDLVLIALIHSCDQ